MYRLNYRILFFFLLILFLLPFSLTKGAWNYSEPFKLGISSLPDATAYYGKHIAVGNDGVVHVVWGSDNADKQSEVWYTRSADAGKTFSPATMIHEGRTGTRPAIAVDPADPQNLFVVYSGSSVTDKKIGIRVIKSTDGGNTWSPSVTVSGRAGTATNPDLIVDDKGNPHVVFNSVYANSIWYTQSLDGGATWLEQPEMVNVGMNNGYGVCISLSPSGELHVLFDSDKATMTPGDKAVFWTWKYNDPDEPIWQLVPAEKIPGSGDGTPYPSIVWDSKGVGHLWFDAAGTNGARRNVFYLRYENEAWSKPEVVPSEVPGGSTCMPSAAIDSEDNLYVIFLDALQAEIDLDHPQGDLRVGTNRCGKWEYFNLTQNGAADMERFPGAARQVVAGVLHLIYTSGPQKGPYPVIYQNCFEPLAAKMEIAPAEFRTSVPQGSEQAETLVISNSGTAALHYAVSWKSPAATAWLKIAKTSGKIIAGQSESIELTFDAKLLDAGDFSAEIRVESNDPAHASRIIPVALQVTETCPPPCIQLSFFQGVTGELAAARISLDGNPSEIPAFDFEIFFPPDLMRILQVTPGNLTAAFENFSWAIENQTTLKISGSTPVNPIPPQQQGSLAEIRFEIINCVAGETVPIVLKKAAGTFQDYFVRHGRFHCEPACWRGDVNRDQVISSGDALCAFYYFLTNGQPPATCQNACLPAVADVNCDELVSPADALHIFDAYLLDLQPPLACLGAAKMTAGDRTIDLSSIVAEPGEKITCAVRLQNTAGLRAFGADLHFPADMLTFTGSDTTRLTRNWVALEAHEIAPGIVRIGGFNPDAASEVENGTVMKIAFTVKNHVAGKGALILENMQDDFAKSTLIPGSFSTPGVAVANLATDAVPAAYTLEPNYPNPFNLETRIRYQLPESGRVNLAIYNALGQKIATLVSQNQPAGTYEIKWNGLDDSGFTATSGIYLVRLEVNEFSALNKLLLLK